MQSPGRPPNNARINLMSTCREPDVVSRSAACCEIFCTSSTPPERAARATTWARADRCRCRSATRHALRPAVGADSGKLGGAAAERQTVDGEVVGRQPAGHAAAVAPSHRRTSHRRPRWGCGVEYAGRRLPAGQGPVLDDALRIPTPASSRTSGRTPTA